MPQHPAANGSKIMGHLAFINLRNVIVRNTLMLALAQASVYLIPLVTTPYIARVLGAEHYGLLGIASNIIGNLLIFTDWGFSLSATREVARNAKDPHALRKIFWEKFGKPKYTLLHGQSWGANVAEKTAELYDKLKKENIIVSLRQGNIRVSPHVYNTERDIDRLIAVITT